MLKQKVVAVALNKFSLYLLGSLILGCLAFYVYFANTAVQLLSTLEKTKLNLESLSVELSELESKRLVIENSINQDLAKSLGMVEVSDKIFITDRSQKTAFNF